MWPDFRYWSDHLLAGRRFHARIHYADFATVKTANVRIVGDDDPLHSVDIE